MTQVLVQPVFRRRRFRNRLFVCLSMQLSVLGGCATVAMRPLPPVPVSWIDDGSAWMHGISGVFFTVVCIPARSIGMIPNRSELVFLA